MAVVYVDGELVPAGGAQLSVFDHGLLVGDGAFEAVLLRHGRPFAIRRHLDRLERSAKCLGIAAPDRGAIEGAIDAVARDFGTSTALGRLRITVTSGSGTLTSKRGHVHPTIVVAAESCAAQPPTESVAVVPWPRNERGALAGVKTTSYAENVIALAWANDRGAGEAIFANTAGNLCEGTGSNVFFVRNGRIATPPLSAGPLAGVTRELVLEQIDCDEDNLPISSFDGAGIDEAFLTSTTRAVQPIHAINGHELPGLPGPVTAAAAARLAALMARTDDP